MVHSKDRDAARETMERLEQVPYADRQREEELDARARYLAKAASLGQFVLDDLTAERES